MKRLTALLLALLLAGSDLPASAATLLEKFTGQFADQGFKGTVALEATGENTDALGSDAWAWLKAAAPRVTVEAAHSFADKSDGQMSLNVLIDGQPAGRTTLLYNSALMGVSSDFLAGYGEAWYTAARDWNVINLLQGLAHQGSEWPPIWHLLTAAEGAEEAWLQEASQHLVLFETKLGAWLNTYAAVSSVTEGEAAYTQLQWRIPAQDVKAEIKALLADFYANEALLALLRQIATPQEAASYLQPGMQPVFAEWIDRAALEGEIAITRHYNAAGGAVLDEIALPFAQSQRLSSLTITVTPEGEGSAWRFRGALRGGETFDVTCVPGNEEIYAGSVALTLPGKDGGEGKSVAFDYNFTWDGGKEEYSLATDRFLQTMEGTLVIKPRESGLPSQSLALKADFSSASSARSSTHLDAVLTWRDLEGDAALTATLTGRTAAPTAVEKLSDQPRQTRVDQLPGSGLAALAQEWAQHLSAWIRDAAEQLLPKEMPET